MLRRALQDSVPQHLWFFGHARMNHDLAPRCSFQFGEWRTTYPGLTDRTWPKHNCFRHEEKFTLARRRPLKECSNQLRGKVDCYMAFAKHLSACSSQFRPCSNHL